MNRSATPAPDAGPQMPALVWLAANYHLPGTYSCRVPMSSTTSAQALPGPGPGTVRLALVHAGIESFGIDYTRDTLFPIIRAAPVEIRPPARVALSNQLLHGYKAQAGRAGGGDRLETSLRYREVAHALGVLTVYIAVPRDYATDFRELLGTIGYWGQSDSLAYCVSIEDSAPRVSECVQPMQNLEGKLPRGQFFSSVMTEFREGAVSWDEILPDMQPGKMNPLRLTMYAWPLVVLERRRAGTLLLRRSLDEEA
jgi:hypothetical protein